MSLYPLTESNYSCSTDEVRFILHLTFNINVQHHRQMKMVQVTISLLFLVLLCDLYILTFAKAWISDEQYPRPSFTTPKERESREKILEQGINRPYIPTKLGPGNGSYFESDTKQYYIEYRYLRAREIKDYCKELNMSMIIIRNWKENMFVRSMENRNLITLGIEYRDARWRWADGSDLSYTNWDDWEPRCGAYCNTIYMKKTGGWYFDQDGVGIVACEKALPSMPLSLGSYRHELLTNLREIRGSIDLLRTELRRIPVVDPTINNRMHNHETHQSLPSSTYPSQNIRIIRYKTIPEPYEPVTAEAPGESIPIK